MILSWNEYTNNKTIYHTHTLRHRFNDYPSRWTWVSWFPLDSTSQSPKSCLTPSHPPRPYQTGEWLAVSEDKWRKSTFSEGGNWYKDFEPVFPSCCQPVLKHPLELVISSTVNRFLRKGTSLPSASALSTHNKTFISINILINTVPLHMVHYTQDSITSKSYYHSVAHAELTLRIETQNWKFCICKFPENTMAAFY